MTNTENQLAAQARREYQRKWRERNADRLRIYNREWRRRNPDKVKAATERYWLKQARENTFPL